MRQIKMKNKIKEYIIVAWFGLLVIAIILIIIKIIAKEVNVDETYGYYELRLTNDSIVRDTLSFKSEANYYYNDKGVKFYTSNIIYSKKLKSLKKD